MKFIMKDRGRRVEMRVDKSSGLVPSRLDCILGTATNINKSELFDPFEHRITSLHV